MIGAACGYKVRIVIPKNASPERKKIITAFGAEIVYSSPFDGSDGAIRLARKLYNEDRAIYFMPDQYNNPSNWMAHRDSTAIEIFEQTKGRVTHFLAGIGTSGTLMGTTRGLKGLNPKIISYAVEPAEALHGIEGLKHMETSIVPGIYDPSVYDEKLSVKTDEAYRMVRRLEEEEGLLVGTSAGAAMVGALKVARQLDEGVVVTIFPDSCEECVVAHGEF
jgi:cysteine synthase B